MKAKMNNFLINTGIIFKKERDLNFFKYSDKLKQ